ncbi:MAG: hypothetical protein QM777_00590 [Pseudorhodoferax sp.]
MHFLILSGANERAIVAACRDLRSDGIGFSIIARPRQDPVARSFLSAHVVATRSQDALDVDDLVQTILAVRHRLPARLIYLPASEALNRLVLQHRERLTRECSLEIPLPPLATYELLSDKASFNALAQQFGLELPPSETSPGTAPLPLVAKPHAEFDAATHRKLYPVLMFEEHERRAFFAKENVSNYFFQRFVQGASHYYLMFFDRTGRCASLFQENMAQQPGGKSILAAQSCDCPSPEFLERLTRCIGSTGFFGFCMVEAITVQGRSYLIELNPRLWGPLSLATRAGFRIAWLGAPEAMVPPAPLDRTVRYAWLSGMLGTRLAGHKIRWYHRKRRDFYTHLWSFVRQDIYCGALASLPMAARELRRS